MPGRGRAAAGGLRADDLALPDGARQRRADRPGAAAGVLRPDHRRLPALPAAGRLSGAGRAWRGSSTGWSRPAGGARSARCGPPAGPARPPAEGPAARRRVGRSPGAVARLARDGAAARVLPGRTAPAGRPDARGVRRLLVPGILLQPGGDLRGRPAAGPAGAGGVDRAPRPGRRRCRPASSTWSPAPAAYYRVLARARWLVNNVNFPDFVRKRPEHGARADPPRHPGQGDGAGPAALPDRRGRDGLRRAAAPGGPLGLQRHREQLLHPDVGAGVSGRLHDAWRWATRATTGWSPPTAEEVRRLRARARHRTRRAGGALRADAPRAPARLPAAVRPGPAARRARAGRAGC